MKVGIIGTGAVGSACICPLLQCSLVSEIVLVDLNAARAKAIATDFQYGAVLANGATLSVGSYKDLADAAVILITAGVNEKSGGATDRNDPEGRLRLLKTNAGIYKDIVSKLANTAQNAVILVVSDPPDPLADIARKIVGNSQIVLSAGTYLDSLRFRFHLAQYCRVNPAYVDALVIGEHGTEEVFVWSNINICGVPLKEFIDNYPTNFQKQVEKEVKFANITIIEGNNASQFGIGLVSARITEMILRNELSVIPIGSYQEKYGATLSLPSIVGERGVVKSFEPNLSAEEKQSLQQCADRLREVVSDIS